MSSKNRHVVPRQKGWAVKAETNQRATSVHRTQREAIDVARKVAVNSGSEVIIHGRDGRIRERNS